MVSMEHMVFGSFNRARDKPKEAEKYGATTSREKTTIQHQQMILEVNALPGCKPIKEKDVGQEKRKLQGIKKHGLDAILGLLEQPWRYWLGVFQTGSKSIE